MALSASSMGIATVVSMAFMVVQTAARPRSASMAARLAPMEAATGWPSRNRAIVGMLWMP